MDGYVSLRLFSSSSSASQRTNALECSAPLATFSSPRYAARPPSLLIDFEVMVLVVSGAAWITLPPASCSWPFPAKATDRISARARRPSRYTAGYFIVTFEPRLPSTHSTVASSYATARLVTRLNTLFDQFWIVVYRMCAPRLAT